MSVYTTELRYICESLVGDINSVSDNVDEIIRLSMGKIFDFDYPMFDEEYKSVLQTKILKHYYTREISSETVGLWKLRLNTKMNEIMSYYNELYKSAKLEFNPFEDVKVTRTHKGSGSNSGESKSNANTWDKFSGTPQGTLENIENESYLTEATNNTNETSATTKLSTTDEWIDSVSGKQGMRSYSSLLMEYRKTIMNIDIMIINELSELFMQIW